MIRPPQDDRETHDSHWRMQLPQQVARVPTRDDITRLPGSTNAKDRRRVHVALRFVSVVIFFSVLAGLAWIAWESESPASAKSATVFDFKSDGQLDEAWLRTKVDVRDFPPLVRVKALLEEDPQVREATVRRTVDNTLVIRVSERTPVARILKIQDDGTTRPYLVATDGVLYPGTNVGQMTFANLPLVVGTKTEQTADGSRVFIPGFDPVAKFLTLARERYPVLYREWLKISLADYKGRPDAPGAFIRVRPRINAQSPDAAAIKEIVFSPTEARFAVELRYCRDFRTEVSTELSRRKYPVYVWDLTYQDKTNPRHPKDAPRLIPVEPSKP